MRTAVRLLILLLALPAWGALAQPELEAFAGSRANLESLASGLREGREIKLTSIATDGMREEAMFTPARPLGSAEAARVMQAGRQALLAHGVRVPGAWDIGIALMGGTIVAPTGKFQLPRLVAPADPERALVISLHAFAGSRANYRNLVRGLSEGTTVTLSYSERRGSIRFEPPGGRLSADEVRQSLQAAGELLAAKGINDPTP